jgi:hypothetical protein
MEGSDQRKKLEEQADKGGNMKSFCSAMEEDFLGRKLELQLG